MSRRKPPLGAPLEGFRETKHGLHCKTQVCVDLPHRKPCFSSSGSFLLPPASYQFHRRDINFLHCCRGDSPSAWGAPQTEVIYLCCLQNKIRIAFLHSFNESLERWIIVSERGPAPIVSLLPREASLCQYHCHCSAAICRLDENEEGSLNCDCEYE